jgi:Methane oxygenase PmoA
MDTMLGLSRAANAWRAVVLFAALPWLAACALGQTGARMSPVVATFAPDGIALSEAGAPILFYRSQPEPGREGWRANYIHPLYSVGGTIITEDAPPDHLHQRGVYWAWRRIMVDGARVADGWVGDQLVLDVASPASRAWPDGSMQIDARATWRVPVRGVETTIIEESSSIRAYPLRDGQRRIVIAVRLRALRSGVQLAGTDDEKGYGGIALRFGRSEQLDFCGDGQALQPLVAAVRAGDELAFRWLAPVPGWPASIRARCRVNEQPWQSWVLRREPSMQNCAFPGREPVAVPQDQPLHIEVALEL